MASIDSMGWMYTLIFVEQISGILRRCSTPGLTYVHRNSRLRAMRRQTGVSVAMRTDWSRTADSVRSERTVVLPADTSAQHVAIIIPRIYTGIPNVLWTLKHMQTISYSTKILQASITSQTYPSQRHAHASRPHSRNPSPHLQRTPIIRARELLPPSNDPKNRTDQHD